MLFGRDRVPAWLHTVSALAVAIGTTVSAFWILALNSWMQTPQGYSVIAGELHAADWFAIIFNPNLPYRLAHMLVASGLTACFLVAGLSAYQLLRNRGLAQAQHMLRLGVLVSALLIPLQMVIGDLHGLNTLAHQPAKIAAIEAIWHTERNVALNLFAWPNEREQRNEYAVTVPTLGSLILTHKADGEIRGLSEFAGKHPPVAPVFFAFRLMVGMAVLMLLVSWSGAWFALRRRACPRWLLRLLSAMTFS